MTINYDKLLDIFLDNGMHPTRAKELVKQVRQDMIAWPELYADQEKVDWAFEKGFLPGRMMLYGEDFNEKTYQNYYPDFEYFMAHPMNNHFIFWINDKLTLKYMLNTPELSQYMPEYYLYIENDGRYSYLMDAPECVAKDCDFIYNLLVEKKHLACKPNHGSGGRGFFGLSYKDGKIFMNHKEISREDFENLKPTMNGYIVTEFIEQSKKIDDVFSEADCALRIVLYKKPQKQYYAAPDYGCIVAYARFGSSKSDGASNLCHGGLAVRINWETGRFEGGFRGNFEFWGKDGVTGFDRHPDTDAAVDGHIIPNWKKIREGLIRICNYMSSLDYFGMDVIITEDSFKLCEINSAPGMGVGQFHQGKCSLDTEDAREYAASKRRPSKKTFIECIREATEE